MRLLGSCVEHQVSYVCLCFGHSGSFDGGVAERRIMFSKVLEVGLE